MGYRPCSGRALEGFEHFLAATPYNELAVAATGGPVVIINASSYGCHALIVDPGSEQPRVITLARLRLDVAVERSSVMLGALAGADDPGLDFRDRERARHAILDVLDWLWDDIAEPVLHALGHVSTPGTGVPWPRVWWCPTGVLSLLPVHAAGHHPRHRTSYRRRLRARPRDLLLHPHLDRTRSHPRTPAPARVRHLPSACPQPPACRHCRQSLMNWKSWHATSRPIRPTGN